MAWYEARNNSFRLSKLSPHSCSSNVHRVNVFSIEKRSTAVDLMLCLLLHAFDLDTELIQAFDGSVKNWASNKQQLFDIENKVKYSTIKDCEDHLRGYLRENFVEETFSIRRATNKSKYLDVIMKRTPHKTSDTTIDNQKSFQSSPSTTDHKLIVNPLFFLVIIIYALSR